MYYYCLDSDSDTLVTAATPDPDSDTLVSFPSPTSTASSTTLVSLNSFRSALECRAHHNPKKRIAARCVNYSHVRTLACCHDHF